MRSRGLTFIIIGLFVVGLFWIEYFNNINYILTLDKSYLFILMFVGMILTVSGGITIGVGIKIVIHPEFYERLKSLIKE